MNEETTKTDTPTANRPRLSFYHPNGRGTGGAVQFELHPAHDQIDGSIFATFARQKTCGTRENGITTYPSFDWENRICVKLDLSDLIQMLQTFRGYQESIADGKGLFHRTTTANMIIKLEHRIEPCPGYVFEVTRREIGAEDTQRAVIMLTVNEAFMLSLAIEQSIGVLAFGIPTVNA